MKYYSIGEAAKINNVSTSMLRYYDEINILKPKKIEDNKYRYYTSEQFEILDFIKRMKRRGVSLEIIKALLPTPHADKISEQLSNEIARIDAELCQIEKRKQDLLQYQLYYSKTYQHPENKIYVEQCESRGLFTVETLDYLNKEEANLGLRKITHSKEYEDLIIYPPYGYLLSSESFSHGKAVALRSTCYIDMDAICDDEHIVVLPEGKYMCIDCSHDDINDAVKKLNEFNSELSSHIVMEVYVKDMMDSSKNIYKIKKYINM